MEKKRDELYAFKLTSGLNIVSPAKEDSDTGFWTLSCPLYFQIRIIQDAMGRPAQLMGLGADALFGLDSMMFHERDVLQSRKLCDIDADDEKIIEGYYNTLTQMSAKKSGLLV